MPRIRNTHFIGKPAHEFEHALPFRKDNDLTRFVLQEIGQNIFEFFQFRTDAAFGVENGGRIAQHAHTSQIHLQNLEFLRRQWALLSLRNKDRRFVVVIVISQLLLRLHAHKEVLHRAAGKLRFHVFLATPQHNVFQASV